MFNLINFKLERPDQIDLCGIIAVHFQHSMVRLLKLYTVMCWLGWNYTKEQWNNTSIWWNEYFICLKNSNESLVVTEQTQCIVVV